MKSTGIIMQDFSIDGLRKQWDWQRNEPQFGDYEHGDVSKPSSKEKKQ